MARNPKRPSGRAPADDPQARFQRAVADYEAGRFAQARKALAPLLELPDREGYITLLAGLVDVALGDWRAAEPRLRRSVERMPRRVEAWVGLGNARHMLGELEAATEAFRHALELQPDSGPVWSNLGVSYAEMRRFEDAVAAFDRALQHAPGHEAAQRGRAEALGRAGRLDAAEAAYRELLARHPDDAALGLEYAELLERANRSDDALAALPAGTELRQPELRARAEALRSRLLARSGELEQALAVVQSARRQTREEWLGYAEGGLLDRLDRPEEALAAFRRANAARARSAAAARLRGQDMLGYLDHKLGQGVAAAEASATDAGRPAPVFIIGLPRSGTTLLDRMLDAHPRVQVLEEPESLRMAEAVTAAGGSIAEARARYWEYLEGSHDLDPDRLPVDKNPLHSLHLDLLPRLFPDARVVMSLRHPYDAALSCYMQDFALNAVTVHFLELESTAAVCARLLRLMALYEQACPARTHRIRYEDLVSGDPRALVEPLLEAMGLSWDPAVADFQQQAARSGLIRSASYEQVTRGLYTSAVERWRRYAAWIGPLREALGPELGYWGYDEG